MKKMMKVLAMGIIVAMMCSFAAVALGEEIMAEEVTLQEEILEALPEDDISEQENIAQEETNQEISTLEMEVVEVSEELPEADVTENEKIIEKEGTEDIFDEITINDVVNVPAEEELQNSDVSVEIVLHDKKVFIGDEVTLIAQTDGVCQFQWQCSLNGGETWENIAGETGKELKVLISESNADAIWRVEVSF